MSGLKTIVVTTALISLTILAPFSARSFGHDHETGNDVLLDGHGIVNVIDDFLLFWEIARDESPRRQRQLFRLIVESRHPAYFENAVYRGASAKDRRTMLDWFLVMAPDRIESLKEFNFRARDSVLQVLFDFKMRFPEYELKSDVYIGLSLFSFDGAVRPVHNLFGIPDTLCLGAEVISDYSYEELQITIAHELFHLYHFDSLYSNPFNSWIRNAYIPLMTEGLAVAGAAAVYPYRKTNEYLHFSERELQVQTRELGFNSQWYLGMVQDAAPADQYRPWFAYTPSFDAPPRGGYLLGYEVVRRVLAAYTLEQMVRMSPAELQEHAEEQLGSMIADEVLLLAAED